MASNPVLTEVLARLARLEQQVAQFPEGETLSPNYFHVGADGSSNAIFVGSLQLPEAAGSPNPSTANSVQWADSTGTLREYIQGFKQNPTTHGLISKSLADATDFAQIQLQSFETGASGTAAILVTVADNTAGQVGPLQIIGSDGRSNFPRLPLVAGIKMCFGRVAGTDGSIQWNGAGGWTSARTGVGVYTVTVAAGTTSRAVFVQDALSNTGFYTVDETSTTVTTIKTFGTNVVALDTDFYFLILATLT